MAKCFICNSRKGKRKCLACESFICSLCCGQTRTPDKCQGCSYFKNDRPKRKYKSLPCYTTRQMANNHNLQNNTDIIESTICKYDEANENALTDNMLKGIIERLLDKFHFKDDELLFSNKVEENGYLFLSETIKENLDDLSESEIVKIIVTVYRSVLRHHNESRAYLNFIHNLIGSHVSDGIRIIKNYQ